jgi:hypothetical protein
MEFVFSNFTDTQYHLQDCGKIGFLPYGLSHIGLKDSSTNLYTNIKQFLSSKLLLKVKHQDDASCCWVCHRRFHGILPKEHSRTFYEVPWGLFKELSTNTRGLPDIVTHTTNI